MFSTIACAVAFGAGAARAEDPPADSSRIEKVTVTAQKRVQDAQDVPASVSALSGKRIDDLGITSSDEIAEFIPNVSIGMPSGQSNQPIITIRGVGNNDYNTNNAGPNGVYADEVYLSAPSAQTFQAFDLERVEVLKGPQGTLYGRNTSSGVINFISAKPSDEFDLGFTGSYGSFNTTNLEGFIGGPTGDTSAGRLSFIYDNSDGYMRNLANGDRVSGTNVWALRGLWQVEPIENLTFLVNVHGGEVDTLPTEYHQVGASLGALSFTPCDASQINAGICTDTFGYDGPSDLYKGNYNRTKHLDIENEGASLRTDYDFGSVTLTSITAYEHNDKLHPEDSDASAFRMLEIDFGVKSNTFTQEFRLAGGTDKFDWLLGAYYLGETLKQDQTIYIFQDADLICGFGCGDIANPADLSTAFAQIGRGISSQKTNSYAIFGQTTFEIFDRTNLTLGGRYTTESKDFDLTGLFAYQTGGIDSYSPFQTLWQFSNNLDNDGFSWRVALDHHFSDDLMAYASVSTGFKSGGFNGGFLAVNPGDAAAQADPVDPEKNLAYEIGVKSDLLDKKLRLNLSAFYYDYTDLQVFNLVIPSGGSGFPINVLDNAPATVKGVEFEGIAKPFENFTLTLTAAYLDAKLETYVTDQGDDYSGNTLPLAPKYSVAGFADYTIPLGNGDAIDLLATASYKSKVFFDLANEELITQDGYWLVDARASYVINEGEWKVSVFGKNLTDEEYLNEAFDLRQTFGFLQQIVGEPLTVGAEVSYRY